MARKRNRTRGNSPKAQVRVAEREMFSRLKKLRYNDKVVDGIALFGTHNEQPKQYLQIANENPYLATTIRGKAKYYTGDGLAYEEINGVSQDLPEEANRRGETYNEILEKVSLDYATFGGFAIVVLWDVASISPDGNGVRRISEIYHVGFDKIRAEEADEFGIINNYYVHNNWSSSNHGKVRSTLEQAAKYPSFNPAAVLMEVDGEMVSQPKQLFVYKNHNQKSDYYPEPDWWPAAQAALLGSKLNKFKNAHTDNGIVMSSHIKITGNYNDTALQQIADDVSDQLSGVDNGGAYMVTTAKEAGTGVSFEPVPSGGQSNVYNDYEESTIQQILSVQQIIFKEAIGLESDSKGLTTEAVDEKMTIFFNVAIRKGSQKILNGLNKLARYIGEGLKFEINKLDLLEGLDTPAEENIRDEEEDTNQETPLL